MSWVLTRMFCSEIGRPAPAATSARTVRMACGAWLVMCSVSCWRTGIPVGDAAARLDRGDVDARDVDVLVDPDLGGGEGGIGRGLVARFPVPDVVVLLVLGPVRAKDERVGLERLVRVDDDRQRLVVDEHGSDAVGGGVAGRGDDRRDLLDWYITVSVGSTICMSPASVGIQCSL